MFDGEGSSNSSRRTNGMKPQSSNRLAISACVDGIRTRSHVCESSAPAGFEAYPSADSLNCGQTRAALDGDRVG